MPVSPSSICRAEGGRTDPHRGFELIFRLYGPKKEVFDKSWTLPDAALMH